MTALAPARSGIGQVFEHRLLQYRRSYRASIFSSFLTPVLFLAAMGLGLGSYVDGSARTPRWVACRTWPSWRRASWPRPACSRPPSRRAFPIMAGLVWSRIFHAMYATPVTGRDIALGNLAWIGARMLLIATVFTAIIVAFGAAASPLIVLAIPAAALTGLAFAAPIMAFSATQRTPEKFNAVFRFGITPLFLFSGTFYPGRVAADLPPAAGLGHPAVARRRR